MPDKYASRTLREIIRVVASRFISMALIIILVIAAVAVATYLAPKWYRSEVELHAKPSGVTNPLEYEPTSTRDEVSLFVRTQRQIIMSDYVLASALMRLVERPSSKSPSKASSKQAWYANEKIGDYVSANGKFMRQVRKRVSVVTPGGPDATFTQTFKIRVDWPEQREEAERLGVSPTVLAARRAYELTQNVTDAYLMRYTQLEIQATKQAEQFLQQKVLVAAEASRNLASNALQDFIASNLKGDLLHVINMVGKGGGGIETGIASLARQTRGTLAKIEEQLATTVALRTTIEKELKRQNVLDLVVPDAVLNSNPPIVKLHERIVLLKLQLNELTPKYTDDHQELRYLKAELLEAHNDLRDHLNKHRTRLDQKIFVLRAREAVLSTRLDQDRAVLDELAQKVAAYQRLQSDVNMTQTIYEEEKKRVVSAATAAGLADKHVLVSVLDAPSKPSASDPRRPIMWLNLLIAAIGGVILALSYAFLSDYFDHTVKSIDDAERHLGVPVLVSVPKLGGRIVRTR